METGLTPREIQERIRAGHSLDEVAAVAEMPRDRVERFALAVFDERRHIADQARAHSVRRKGEPAGQRTLDAAVKAHLTHHDLDPETVTWDATRGEDRHFWTVTSTWPLGDGEAADTAVATFGYDVRGTFSVAEDDIAREVLDAGYTQPGGPLDDEPSDDEPTLNYADQFAIVNAVQTESDIDHPDDEAIVGVAGQHTNPFDLHDIVPTPESELDALYAMLRGHQEDSVIIYAGLADDPIPQPASAPPVDVNSTTVGEPPADDTDDPQLPLDAGEPVAPTKPKKRPRKRAAVPTWDEIMFGGPDTDQ